MKKELTRNQLFELWYVLKDEKFDNEKLDKRFDYIRSRNLELLSSEVNQLLKARDPSNIKFGEFEKKQEEIFVKYGELRDIKRFIKDEYKDIAIIELTKLKEEYKDVIQERKEEIDIYNELLYEKIEFDIAMISFKYLPDIVSSGWMKALRPMIKETDEEINNIILES